VGDEDGNLELIECARAEWIKNDATGQMSMNEVPGSDFILRADTVLLAMGFVHPQHDGLLDALGVHYDDRGNVETNGRLKTNIDKVFACGDMQRGQSLVVHAIASGRRCARQIDIFLMGDSRLPTVSGYARPSIMAVVNSHDH
jgi:glutamate synthase (NADPH/NADH) small chain